MKPCPFCGSLKIKREDGTDGSQGHVPIAYVKCYACQARGPEIINWQRPDYRELSERAWDKREPAEPPK